MPDCGVNVFHLLPQLKQVTSRAMVLITSDRLKASLKTH